MSGIILVTGGNIGNSVVDGLRKKGKKVRVTVLKKQSNPSWERAGVEQAEFDYSRPDTLERAFEGVESYFSVSPLIQNLSETGIQSVNAARRAGVRHIVRSSVLGASDDGITFARWHRAIEKAVEQSGMTYTILQPTGFMQNYLRYADSIKSDGKFYAPVGNAKASFVDSRDIADVAVLALTERGHIGKKYKITGGEAVSNSDVAEAISEATGKTVLYIAVSEDDARKAMLGMGMPPWMADGMTELNQIMAKGWLANVEPDLENLLGRKPRTLCHFAQDFRFAFLSPSTQNAF
jgi:uncharacterized protein YbjT (DUF2867 family)